MLHSVNKATGEALTNEWVTSASILVPCPWFPEVARFAHEHPEWDLGIHLALTSEWTPVHWRPLSFGATGSSLTDKNGFLPGTTAQVGRQAQVPDIVHEMRAQIDSALALGVNLSHLDAHMWAAARATPAEYLKLGRSYGLPVVMGSSAVRIDAETIRSVDRPHSRPTGRRSGRSMVERV